MSSTQDEVKRIFNRLRARLFNMVEQMPFDTSQQEAYKQTVKDVTSNAWNDITRLCQENGLIDEE